MAYNNDRNSRSGGDRGGFRPRPSFGGSRPRFNDRDSRGPVEMHDAICDNCGKSCQVPFRPTSGKPVYCSNCFEQKGGNDSRGYESRPPRPEGRPAFTPRRDEEPRVDNRFEELNAKLDKILSLLSPNVAEEVAVEEEIVEVKPKKRASKKSPVTEA